MKKRLGIIGGMGPLATNIFYNRIIENTKAESDQDHIWTVISSHTTMPDRTDLIVNKRDENILFEAVQEDIDIMEAGKVANIAIPCNTFHNFYDQVCKLTYIPIINMVEETIKELRERKLKIVILLATKGTLAAGTYKKYADVHGIKLIDIDDTYNDQISEIIYSIKADGDLNDSRLVKLINELGQEYEAQAYILACTELSLIPLDNLKDYTIVDAMDILIRESILRSGYELDEDI